MLAAIFIQGGINSLRNPQGHVQAAKPVLDAVTPVLEQATDAAAPTIDKTASSVPVDLPPTTNWLDDENLVRIDGAVKVVAGTMLALGKAPRLASTALAAALLPHTVAGPRFWEETAPEATPAQLKGQCQTEYNTLRDQVLEFLIRGNWIEQETKKQKLKVTNKDVQKQIDAAVKQAFQNPQDFQKFLQRSGLTEADVFYQQRNQLLQQKLTEKVTKAQGKVTNAQIQQY